MTARRLLALAAVAVAAGLVALAGRTADTAQATHGCSANQRDSVARTAEAVAFTKGATSQGVAKRFGCYVGRGSTIYLNGAQGTFGVAVAESPLALSGQFVAYVRLFGSAAGGDASIVTVRNLEDGRVLHESEGSARGTGNPEDAVAALVTKRNGSVAWTTRASNPGDANSVQLIDVDGQRRILEQDTALDPGSLALSEDRTQIYWTTGGQPRSAPLP